MSEETVKLAPTVHFAGLDCDVYRTNYLHGGAIALYLTNQDEQAPVATATVNVPGVDLAEDQLLIKDYSENTGMMDTLQSAGIVRDTGQQVPVGFTHARVAQLLV